MTWSRNHVRVLVLCACGLLGSWAAQGMDTAFSYQGRLSVSGSPADGHYDFRFILYDAEIGGSQVGPILYGDDIEVADGLFTVYLDFGAGVFTGGDRWLEVAVRPGDETGSYTLLTPRQVVLPSPYSLHSGGVSWTDITDIPSGYADDADADPTNELQTLSMDGSTLSLSSGGGEVVLPLQGALGYSSVGGTGFGTSPQVDLAEVTFDLDETSTVLVLADVNPWGYINAYEDSFVLEFDGVAIDGTAVHVDCPAVASGNNGISVSTSWMMSLSEGTHTVKFRAWGGSPGYKHAHLNVVVLSN